MLYKIENFLISVWHANVCSCHGSSQSILAPFSLLSVYFQFVWATHCIWCYSSTQKGKREDHEEEPKEELYEVVWNKTNISVARNYFISCSITIAQREEWGSVFQVRDIKPFSRVQLILP